MKSLTTKTLIFSVVVTILLIAATVATGICAAKMHSENLGLLCFGFFLLTTICVAALFGEEIESVRSRFR